LQARPFSVFCFSKNKDVIMNPLLITLTGEDSATMGRRHGNFFTKNWKKASRFIPGVNTVMLAQRAARKIKEANRKKAYAELKRKQDAQNAATAAHQTASTARTEAANNPTPENNAAADTATTNAAALTAVAKTVDAIQDTVDANTAPTDDQAAPPTVDQTAPPTDDQAAPPTDDQAVPPTDDQTPIDDATAPPVNDATTQGDANPFVVNLTEPSAADKIKKYTPVLLVGAAAIAAYCIFKKKVIYE
jgi:hypothetical protein